MALALAGCSEKESANLERQFQILADTDSSDDALCSKGNEVADAYLREGDAEKYLEWRDVRAGTHCAEDAVKRLRLVQ